MLLKNNKMLGKHGIGKMLAGTTTHGPGKNQQKSPMQPKEKGRKKKREGQMEVEFQRWKKRWRQGQLHAATDAPQPRSSMTPQTFFTMHAFYNLLLENGSKEDLHVPHDPCVQSFMCIPEIEFSYLAPSSMVLDLGCTRAMSSKRAAQGLMEFCNAHPDCEFWYRLDHTTSQFTFANSESASCKQKTVACMYDRDYAIQSTGFDIVEQGEVPFLMSLPQMRNL